MPEDTPHLFPLTWLWISLLCLSSLSNALCSLYSNQDMINHNNLDSIHYFQVGRHLSQGTQNPSQKHPRHLQQKHCDERDGEVRKMSFTQIGVAALQRTSLTCSHGQQEAVLFMESTLPHCDIAAPHGNQRKVNGK